jgi:chitinase
MLSLAAAVLAAPKPLVPNQNPQMTAWEDEIIKSRVSIPDDPAGNTTYNRAKVSDAVSRKRGEGAEIVGYYSMSWSENPSQGPVKPDIGIAFSGWSEVYQALASGPYSENLHGRKYLAVGGANVNGHLSVETLKKFEENVGYIKDAGFAGVAFDIEHTEREGLYIPAMEEAFKACKKNHLKVLVTVSHSAPIVSRSPGNIVDAWVKSDNIDYLSPQLYSTGKEKGPQFDISNRVQWQRWKGAKAAIIPSIVDATHWPKARDFFQNAGIPVKGYLQWAEC